MINKSWLRPQWQEIDYQADAGIAPFDSNDILLLVNDEIVQGRWIKFGAVLYGEPNPGVVEYGGFFEYLGFSQNEFDSIIYEDNAQEYFPTHWMPIPEFLKGCL